MLIVMIIIFQLHFDMNSNIEIKIFILFICTNTKSFIGRHASQQQTSILYKEQNTEMIALESQEQVKNYATVLTHQDAGKKTCYKDFCLILTCNSPPQ